jgi:phage tail sheath protein FI
MSVTVSYPGVYIQEFAPAPPIQGVGTSTPAFIGVASSGTLRHPTLLTSWDMFRSTFGNLPVPGFFLYYAVRGFFAEGGHVCYVVRASNGQYGTLTINTRVGNLTLFTVSASQPGAIPISISIANSDLIVLGTASLYRPTGNTTAPANIGDRQLALAQADAAKFRPGDTVTAGGLGESLQIVRIATATVITQLTNAAGINATATSLTVASVTGFPTAGDFTITVDTEAMTVTAGQGTTTWTVTRGVNGTTAATHAVNAPISFAGAALMLGVALTKAYAIGTVVRLANAPPGATVFRIASTVPIAAGSLVTGTMLTIAQGPSTTLTNAGGIGAADTSLTVASAAGFPTTGSFTILVDTEAMTVTAGAGTTTWTVTRGVNGTTAATHAVNAPVSGPPANTGTQIVSTVQTEQLGGGTVTYRVTLQQGLAFPIDMTAAAQVNSEEFMLTITQGGATQVYDHLALDGAHPRNYLAVINSDPTAVITVTAQQPPPPIPMPVNMPAATGGALSLAGGMPENLTTIADQDFIDALDTLHSLNDVSMIAIPDRTTPAVQQAVIAQCELLADRFGVLDSQAGLDPFDPAAGLPFQRAGLDSAGGYAALYYPWLRVSPAVSGDTILVPPSGHTCGVFARVDDARGVFKAPANEIFTSSLGLERVLSDIDQGILNLAGINVTRVFQTGGQPVLYGARTTATSTNWQYVNIRRLFIFLEKSIQEGIRWAVFEPNTTQLWGALTRSIGSFLNQQWRDGALFGDKATDAYYVRIDAALNPFSEQQLGRLHIEIGVRPSYPAEFIIVRIGIWPGGSTVSET